MRGARSHECACGSDQRRGHRVAERGASGGLRDGHDHMNALAAAIDVVDIDLQSVVPQEVCARGTIT